MAVSTVVKVKRDLTLAFADNGGFGGLNVLTIAFEPGDWNANAPGKARLDFLDRGDLVGAVRFGDAEAVNGSFSTYFRDATDATDETLLDMVVWSMGGAGGGAVASGWVPTLYADAEVKTADLQVTIEGSDHGDGADHTITIPDVSFDFALNDGDPVTNAVNYRSHTAHVPTFA